MKIVCTGSVAYDYLMSFPGYFKDHILPDRLESISLSFLVDAMVKQRGGVAPNIAYTLALLGARPILLATVGEDFAEYREWLESNHIDTCGVKVIPGTYTASFFANTDCANAQIASFYTGAMAHAAELKISDIPGEKPDLVVVSPNSPEAMQEYPRECIQAGIPYLYDPSQQIVRLDGAAIREGTLGAESLFVNEYEFELLLRATHLTKEDILKHVKFMVVTLGAKGATVYSEGREHNIAAFPTDKILDPTGVGDAFRGGFLTGYRCGMDWITCGQMGSLAAAYCLEHRGPQNHFYTKEQFIQRYREVFDDDGKLDCLLNE
ncbi:MAG: carbohydrate kinase family protein [Anaerolinea sp.]|nr:carbohydrate kinase family protein [Anaerolinea sp.]